ncbi:MAG: hypothetical protein FJ293_01155 [Planctomycetes bacterium]|nr:hypothetical protein [Planctomycetota bacterium]
MTGAPRRRAAVALLVALAAAAFHATYAFDGIALFDEGILIDGAWRVRDGAIPGIDGWMPYGPGMYWLLAPFLAWCGESVAVVRAVLVALHALSAGALCWLLLGTATLPGALLATAVLVVAHGSFHKSAIVVAALLALFAAQRLARRDGRGAFVAGLLCALGFLFRHDVGGFAAAACGVALLVEPGMPWRRRCAGAAALTAGFAALLVPLVLALVAAGLDLGAWWEHEWQRIAVQEQIAVPLAEPRVDGEWRGGRVALLCALLLAPLVLLLWGSAAWWRARRDAAGPPTGGETPRIAAALFGLLLLNQVRLIPSANHLFQAIAPVALALGDALARRGRGWRGHGALALLVVLLVTWVAGAHRGIYSGTFRQRLEPGVEPALERAGIRLKPEFARALEATVTSIRRRVAPNQTVATSPGAPLLAFLADRMLAIPCAEASYWYHEPRFQAEAIAALERNQPPLLVTDGSSPATFAFEAAAPLVARWLAERYRPVEQHGPFTLHERRR